MGKYDISFKALAERPPYRVVRALGHVRIREDAVVPPLERELAVPLKAVDQSYLVGQNGKKWIEHFEAEVGLSVEDRREITHRANLLAMKSGLPVWTTIVLMSRWRGPANPPRVFESRVGSLTIKLEPRYVKLWEVPAKVLIAGDLAALPWIGATKATATEMNAAIEQIRGVDDPNLRGHLGAELVTLSHLQYGKQEVEYIRGQLMVTTEEILKSTPLWNEVVRYGKKLGREEGRTEGRTEGRQEGRREERLRMLTLLVRSRIPSCETDWFAQIQDEEVLSRMFEEVLAAGNAKAARAVLARYRTAR